MPNPVPDGTKYCHGCKNIKPIQIFYRSKKSKDGLSAMCMYCLKARRPKR